jgi:small subunit ribosomal protein S2
MKDLLEAGAHFGHKVSRWNPKMRKFIFGEKNGIYIIDLQKTVKMLEKAYTEIVDIIKDSKTILFVGTKRQAQDIIREEAIKCDAFYICERWLGGMLTNFRTIRRTIDRLIDLDKKKEEGFFETLPKKEGMSLTRKMEKMEKVLGGVKSMKSLPDLIYVVDIKREYIAVHEANILGIPVVAIVDTNTDPDIIKIPIPANDDAIRSIKLISSIISHAVIDGKRLAESAKAEKEAEKKIAKEIKKEQPKKVTPKKKPLKPKPTKTIQTKKKKEEIKKKTEKHPVKKTVKTKQKKETKKKEKPKKEKK